MRSSISNYLSKATSRDLRLSYLRALRLPHWAHSSCLEDSLDQLPAETLHRQLVSLSSVQPEERIQVLLSFLRYELVCRACLEPGDDGSLDSLGKQGITAPYGSGEDWHGLDENWDESDKY